MGLSKAEQVKRIKNIMGKDRGIPEARFRAGKYAGRTLEWIFDHDPNYLIWVYHNTENLSKTIEAFIHENLIR